MEEEKRTGPVEFVGQSVDELKKVVWPTGEQVRGYFVVVLVFVAFIIAVVTVLDLLFGNMVTWLFG
ncbi:MAG: preprotein translocase subunit SecE [Propionibacterium sp.]|nr:preprotein translocase subunit SecE [Propionibacterium sp.]